MLGARSVHGGGQCVAEAELVDIRRHLPGNARELGPQHGVLLSLCRVGRCGFRHLSAVVLVAEHEDALHEVADDGHQLVVVLVLEILPRELAVLELGEDGGKRVAQLVLPVRPALDVLVQPHRPVA